jgi:hypothetical protein
MDQPIHEPCCIFGVLAGISLVVLAFGIFRLMNHGAPAAGVSISSPRSGDRVAARSIEVYGQSSHLSSGEI